LFELTGVTRRCPSGEPTTSGDAQMKTQLLLAAAAAALVFAAAPASAGPCSDQIASLEKALSSKDAGMGPTDTSKTDTGAQASSDQTSGQTGTTPKAGQVPGTE